MLLEQGAGKIVAGTRKPEKLADLAARGVVVRQADFEDPKGLEAALAGVDRVLIISTDAIDRPGRRLEAASVGSGGGRECGSEARGLYVDAESRELARGVRAGSFGNGAGAEIEWDGLDNFANCW